MLGPTDWAVYFSHVSGTVMTTFWATYACFQGIAANPAVFSYDNLTHRSAWKGAESARKMFRLSTSTGPATSLF